MFRGWIFNNSTQYGRLAGGPWWLVMAPGLALILLALAILIWPELLAYMVAAALLFAGLSLTAWGWSMRRALRSTQRRSSYENDSVVYYTVR